MNGDRDIGTFGRCKKGVWDPHESPEAISEKLPTSPLRWLRRGPPPWVQFGGAGGWQNTLEKGIAAVCSR